MVAALVAAAAAGAEVSAAKDQARQRELEARVGQLVRTVWQLRDKVQGRQQELGAPARSLLLYFLQWMEPVVDILARFVEGMPGQ